MMLFLNATSQHDVECTNLGYWVKDHESAFEILTQLVADNWILQNATISDQYDRMVVPVEVFDGQPIQVHIQALQQQWQQILSNPPVQSANTDKQRLKDWYTQLDGYYESMLAHLEKMVLLLEIRKSRLAARRNEMTKHRLRDQYDLLLDNNRKMHKQTEVDRQKNRNRLTKLEQGR